MHEQDDAVISTNQRARMFGCSERCCIRPFHYVITLLHSILNPDWLISIVFSCVRFRTARPNRDNHFARMSQRFNSYIVDTFFFAVQ